MTNILSDESRARVVSIICGLVSVVVVIGFWEIAGRSTSNIAIVFPPPSRFVPAVLFSENRLGIGAQSTTISQAIFATLCRVTIGLLFGFIAAIICAVPISASLWVRRFLYPLVRIMAPVAPVAWIPLGLVLLGIGNQTAVFIVFMGVFFTLTIGAVAALDAIPKALLENADVLGCSPFQRWFLVVCPYCLPAMFTMLRLNFIAAWMAVLAAEMTGLRDGLGSLVMLGRNLFDNNLILFGMSVIGLCGCLVDFCLSWIQKKYFWWGDGGTK